MVKEIVTVDEDTPVAETCGLMAEKLIGCSIVLSKGRPVGILTERDVTYKIAAKGLNPNEVMTSEIMSTPLVEIEPDASLVEAAKLMNENKIRRLAVAKKGILYGIISAIDISRNLEGCLENEIRNIIRHAFFIP